MSRRVIRSLVYLIAVIALLVGCVAPVPPAAAPPAAAEQPAAVAHEPSADMAAWAEGVKAACDGSTVSVAVSSHPAVPAFRAMTPGFTELTGIKVVYDELDEGQAKDKQFLEATGHTGLYDVLMMDSFWVPEYVAKQVALPLDDFVNDPAKTPAFFDWEDILPAFRSGLGMSADKIYGVPFAGETRFLAYRKDLFEKYGQKVPETLDEMLETARFFVGKEDGLYGIGHRAQKGIFFASGWLTHVYDFGDGFVDQKAWTSRMTSQDVKNSLVWFTELLKTAPPDVLNYTHEEATSAFTSGNVAMWFDSTALVPAMEDPEKSQVVGKVGYAKGPVGPNGRGGGTLAGWDFALSPDSANKDCAWAFIMYMTSKEMAKDYVAGGGVPGRTSTLLDPEFQAANPSAQAQLDAYAQAQDLVAAGLHWIPPTPVLGKILTSIGTLGSLPLAEGADYDVVLKQADAEVTDILSEANQ